MKKITYFFSILFISILLTGCVQCDMELKIKNKDEGSFQIEFLLADEALESYGKSINDIKNQFLNSSEQLHDWEFENIEKDIDKKTYHGFIMKAPEKQVKEMLNHLKIEENEDQTVYTLQLTHDDLGQIDTSEIENYSNTLALLQGNGAKFEFHIVMPGHISESSIGQIDDDTVTINLLNYITDSHLKEIKITSVKDNSQSKAFLYLGIGAVILIALVVIYYKTKRNK